MRSITHNEPGVKYSSSLSFVFGSLVFLVIGLVAFFTLGQTTKWVGHTDREVRFVVTDAKTGQPVPSATIHVRVRAEAGGVFEDREQRDFTIATDEQGGAKSVCKSCMCFGFWILESSHLWFCIFTLASFAGIRWRNNVVLAFA